MAITVDGANVYFSDGSTWDGHSSGGIVVDSNSSNTATNFSIGHLILANNIFVANGGGYNAGGFWVLPLNGSIYYSYYVGFGSSGVFANVTAAANDSRLGSQSYYLFTYSGGTGQLSGTWRGRGQATAAGVYQYYGYFVLMERVA
jgi:hypothetical protein